MIVAGGTASGLHRKDFDVPIVAFPLGGAFSILGTAEITTILSNALCILLDGNVPSSSGVLSYQYRCHNKICV